MILESISQKDRALPHASMEDDNDFIDLRRIWRAIWSRKWSILTLVLVVTLLTSLLMMSIKPLYKASATVMIEPKGNQPLTFQPITDQSSGISEFLQTQLSLIQSRGVAEKVVRDLRLTEHPDFDPRQQPQPLINIAGLIKRFSIDSLIPGAVPSGDNEDKPMTDAEIFDAVTQNLMQRTEVWAEGKSQLVNVAVEMPDRLTAAMVANALAQSYIEKQLESQMEMSLASTNWMNTRLTELRATLQSAEDKLQAYREAEGLVDVGGVSTISANTLSVTGDRMIDARRARAEAESQYRQVETMRKAGLDRLTSVPAVLSNPLIQQFKAEEARARAKVEELSRRYGENHPSMIAARSDLSAAKASLQTQVDQVVAGIERNYQLAVANENSLDSSFNKNKAQIQDISRKEFKLRELQRDVDSNRTLYDTFMTRMQETAATSDMNSSNARIVDTAIAPIEPSAPNKRLIIVIAAFMSLVVGIGLALLLDVINNTFKSPEDVETKLNLPVLGIVPLIPKKSRVQIAHQFEQSQDKRFCEAIRTIRTSVMLSDMSQPHKVVVITSSVPGEGKSAVAANLAFAMGQLERVLLIDADLRRPTLAKSFDFPVGAPGLANLIAGTAKAEDCIHTVGKVDMLPAGVVPPNPLELLASPRFAKFLEVTRERYDRIIVDSPPSQAVSDATLLSTFANAVIYVIKSESTAIPLAQKGIGQLLQSGAPLTGVVLNQVDVQKAAKHGSYSGYYDHYGYSNGEEKA